MFDSLDHPQQRAFLRAYAEVGTVSGAASAAGISRETHYEWKRSHADYAEAYEHARQMAGGALEDEAVRRARYGQVEYIVSQGQVVEYQGEPLKKHRYSDGMLLKLLGSHLPELYKERKEVEHKGEVKHKHQHAFDYTSFSDEELTTLERLAEKARTPGPGRDPGGTPTPEASKN